MDGVIVVSNLVTLGVYNNFEPIFFDHGIRDKKGKLIECDILFEKQNYFSCKWLLTKIVMRDNK